jgi:threonine synthase
LYIGLKELQQENIIDDLPIIIGVQAENCAPLEYAWKKHSATITYQEKKETIADGIAIVNPLRLTDILSAVKETNGVIITVTEKEILDALLCTLRKGYYIEPTSAVAIAGFKKYLTKQDEVVVLPLTGHGLKANKTYVKNE